MKSHSNAFIKVCTRENNNFFTAKIYNSNRKCYAQSSTFTFLIVQNAKYSFDINATFPNRVYKTSRKL